MCSILAIPIALYRPQIGPPARNGKKWPKNGKMAIFDPFLGQFSHFSAIFSPFSRWGLFVHFLSIFFPFRAGGPIWGLYRAIGIAILYRRNLNFRGHFRGHLRVHSRVHFREHFRERVRGSNFAVRVLCACLRN